MRFNTFKTVQFEFFVFLLFFRILEHVKNRHFTWVCFSAPNPIWRVLHCKPYEVLMPGLLPGLIFLEQKNLKKCLFFHFFDIIRIAWRCSRYLKITLIVSPIIPREEYKDARDSCGKCFFSRRTPFGAYSTYSKRGGGFGV